MIDTIKYIGEYALKGKSIEDEDVQLELFTQDPASTPDYKHVLSILLNKVENDFEFGGIRLEQYTRQKLHQYIYRRGLSGNGSDLSPTSRITDIYKTFDNKILRWFNDNLSGDACLEIDDVSFLNHLRECLVRDKKIILSDLNLKIKSFGKDDKGIVTLLINGKYIGEYSVFKKLFVKKSISDFYCKHHSISISKDKVCSVCRQDNKTVYGFVSTFNSYSVNKIGFVSGFDRNLSWKNYPVCHECALILEKGKKYLQEFLYYKVYGINYYVIPKLLIQNKNRESYEIFDILEKFKEETEGDIKIEKGHQRLLSHDEKEITAILAEQKNYLNFNFIFYDEGKNRNEFKILLYTRGIYPSRLKKLFDSKNYVDKKFIFKNSNINFTFGNIRYFFDKREFLELSNNIFTNMKIDYYFLIKNIMNIIQGQFINGESTKLSALLGLQLLDYLNNLNILERFEGGLKMNEKINYEKNDENIEEKKIDIFKENDLDIEDKIVYLFNQFPPFFNRPAKKAVFLEGALTQLLLDVQRIERNIKIGQSSPFWTKLQDLKLDKKIVTSLLPEIQNKFEEYNKNYYRELESIISRYMIMAGEDWKMSKDEISFYFVIGMNLKSMFKSKKKEKEMNNETKDE